MQEIEILYNRKGVISAVKPAGILSEGRPESQTIGFLVAGQLGVNAVYPINRLDRVTGGVMLLSSDSEISGKLSGLVASGGYKKSYFAVLEGIPEENCGVFEDILFFDRRAGKTFAVSGERKGAKPAKLEYRVIRTVNSGHGDRTLVSVRLYTGRTHQIRAQFSLRRLPLCGDGKYGGRDNGCSCALWSASAEFENPINHEKVSVSSCPPRAYPWDLFEIQDYNL